MKKLFLDDMQLNLLLTAISEKWWSCKDTPAGENYKRLRDDIRTQIKTA